MEQMMQKKQNWKNSEQNPSFVIRKQQKKMLFTRKVATEKEKQSRNQSAENESQGPSVGDIPHIKSLHFLNKKFPVFSKVQVWKSTFQEQDGW